MVDIAACFRHYGWTCEEVDPEVWHSTFTVETGGEPGDVYELYVLAADDWVQLAVSPLYATSFVAVPERLLAFLLHTNQDLRLARLALDAEGDVNLLVDLPAQHINAEMFGQVLELLAYYASELGPQLRSIDGDLGSNFAPFIGD
jgi:hypothetical protein